MDEEYPEGWFIFKLYIDKNKFIYLVAKEIQGALLTACQDLQFYQEGEDIKFKNAYQTPYRKKAQRVVDDLNKERKNYDK